MGVGVKLRGTRAAAVVSALALLGWRLAQCPLPSLWRDPVAAVAAYAAVDSCLPEGVGRRALLGIALAYLVGVHLANQLPRTFEVLGL